MTNKTHRFCFYGNGEKILSYLSILDLKKQWKCPKSCLSEESMSFLFSYPSKQAAILHKLDLCICSFNSTGIEEDKKVEMACSFHVQGLDAKVFRPSLPD